MKIKIDTRGRIIAGDSLGSWVKIEDDEANTGGYLIHTSLNRDFNQGHDDWVPDQKALEDYFRECDWEIQWTR